VDIGEENDDFASRGEELGDLEGGDIVSGVRATSRGGSYESSDEPLFFDNSGEIGHNYPSRHEDCAPQREPARSIQG
jgi:hypothetical protein